MPPEHQHTRATVPPAVVRYTKICVAVVKGPDAGLTREIAGSPLRIGTSPDNDFVLSDNSVSRHHCAIEPIAGGTRLRDEGSTNGVMLSGMRIYDAIVGGPVQVALGESIVAITPLAETVERKQVAADRFGDLLGVSARMRELFADLEAIAPSEVSLLIEGETGTGKELVAESVHRASARADGPFVVFDCGAVAPTLVESELFGHERGAFTGAVGVRQGLFEQADKGTIFLDELGELPSELQPKLLRVLEKREVRRLGSQRAIPINVRVVAATNRNLEAEIARDNFRQDLFFRIATVRVYVPPLRDRMEDLPVLVEHFLSLAQPPRTCSDVPEHVWAMLRAHRWPGNVREVANAVQRLLVQPNRAFSMGSDTSSAERSGRIEEIPFRPLRVARREAADAFERDYLDMVLARTEGNVTRAAAIAEVSRQMIQKLMRKHGMG